MKNKFLLIISSVFILFFICFLFKISDNTLNSKKQILESPDVLNITNAIETRLLVTPEELPTGGEWTQSNFQDASWSKIKIPEYRLGTEKDYKEGNFAYYRIHIPKSEIDKLSKYRDEIYLNPYFTVFSRYEVSVNGKFYRANTSEKHEDQVMNIPVEGGRENVVAIKGWIKTGDGGINHRWEILLGKGSELNEVFRLTYKVATVFPQIFILSMGSVLFLFSLIFLVINVSPAFEKFLVFGFCVLTERFLSSDYLANSLNMNQLTYLFTLVNIGAVTFLFLFFRNVQGKVIPLKNVLVAVGILSLLAFGIDLDVLHTNYFFNINRLLQFWSTFLAVVILISIPGAFRTNRPLAFGMAVSFVLVLQSNFLYSNIGIIYKALGQLVLFFAVAYETLLSLRREQDLLLVREKQLSDQEKDVAIGKTAALLAHDVRRPLEQMRLVLERVTSGGASKEFLETAKRDVEFSLTSVNNQVTDIMNFSRNRSIDLVDTSFYRILSASLKQVMTINQDVQLKLEYDLQGQHKILGDESRLARVLTNLISNAVEAIRDIGKRDHGVLTFKSKSENGWFTFSLTNDGPQIPEEIRNEIFKPLFTHGKEKGTGLGLASVMRSVQDHQGSIEVANTNAGVTFTIRLKMSGQSDQIPAAELKAHSKDYGLHPVRDQKSQEVLRVLVLDDDTQVFDYFRFLSSHAPLQVELTFASSYAEAEKEVSSRRFDLYILDYDLGQTRTGSDFYQQYLSYLSDEVVFHSNRDKSLFKELPCQHRPKPLPAEDFHSLLLSVNEKRKRILVVDDSELVLEAWTLYHGSHNLQTASNPEEALKLVSQNSFDFIVLDFYFDNSRMNGDELGRKMRELGFQGKIVISSNAPVKETGFTLIAKSEFELRKLVLVN